MVIHGAGNESKNTDALSGSMYADDKNSDLENHIIVAATTANDTLTTFSNFGQNTVHLGAPGLSIYYQVYRRSDTGTITSGYTFIAGTSFSAPIITGTVALLAAAHPTWTPAQIKEAILESVDPIPSLDGKVKTGGRLNIGDAINYSFDPVAQKPNAPSELSVLLQTNGSFQFKWKDNSKNENSFELQYSLDNGTWTTINNINLSRNKTTATFTISPSGNYQFRIRAVNNYGESDWSGIISVIKNNSTPPSAPTIMTSSNSGYISLSWNTIAGADNYRLERTLYEENNWQEVYFGTDYFFNDDDLAPNRMYSYRVFAISSNIASSASEVRSQRTWSEVPDTPTGITVSMLGANTVQLIWSDVKYALSYYIERFDSKKKQWVEIDRTNVASFTDTSLQSLTKYSYRIIAENGEKSDPSQPIEVTTLSPAPKAPTSVKAVAQGNSVALTWKAATGATAYRVEYSLTGQADSWETILLSSQTLTGGTATGLTPNTKYYFRVYAISDSGESEKPSSTIYATTPPEEPENLVIKNITDKTITLTWDAVGGATSYKVEKFLNGKWSSAGTAKATVTELTVKSLKALTDYKFRVIALNKSVKSEASNEVTVTTPFAMTTTITKSGYAISGSDFAFMFTGKTPIGNNKTTPVTETFQYELIVSSSTKTDKNTGELLDSFSLGTIYVILSSDGKTYTSEPVLFRKLAVINDLTKLKTVQFQLKVTCPTSTSTSQQASTFCTKVAKLALPKWYV